MSGTPPDVLFVIFQWKAFLVAYLLGFLIESNNRVGWMMSGIIHLIILKTTNIAIRGIGLESTSSNLRDLLEAELKVEDAAGSIIGLFERALYLYALFSQQLVILGAVMTFKAFSGWVTIAVPEGRSSRLLIRSQSNHEGTQGNLDFELKRNGQVALLHFYIYAIGNFLSLIVTILAFEILRSAIANFPIVRDYLYIARIKI